MQGFWHILFSPDEVAQIIAHCEERLMKANIISQPFTVAKIQGGVLKDHLQDKDYLALHKVIISKSQTLTNNFFQKVSFCQ